MKTLKGEIEFASGNLGRHRHKDLKRNYHIGDVLMLFPLWGI